MDYPYGRPFEAPEHRPGYAPNPNHTIPCMCCCCYNYEIALKQGLPSLSKSVSEICTGLCAKITSHIETFRNQKKHAQAADENTLYAFTLTMPPDYVLKKPLPEVARMVMEYGLTNKPYEKADRYAYVLEHTDAGTPHIHGVYKTKSGRRISSKYFKRYHDLWDEKIKFGNGHKGGYHQKARHNESYEGYMEKEGVVIKSPPPV